VSTQVVTIPFSEIGQKSSNPLNATEQAAIQGIMLGLDNGEIAKRLGFSPKYIKNVLRRAYSKLGIHTSRQLFPLVIAAGMELRTGQRVLTRQ